jgi:hypothetical protein
MRRATHKNMRSGLGLVVYMKAQNRINFSPGIKLLRMVEPFWNWSPQAKRYAREGPIHQAGCHVARSQYDVEKRRNSRSLPSSSIRFLKKFDECCEEVVRAVFPRSAMVALEHSSVRAVPPLEYLTRRPVQHQAARHNPHS